MNNSICQLYFYRASFLAELKLFTTEINNIHETIKSEMQFSSKRNSLFSDTLV